MRTAEGPEREVYGMKKSSCFSISVLAAVLFLTAVLATMGCASNSWAAQRGITRNNSLTDNMRNAVHLGISADERNQIVQIEVARSGGIMRETVGKCLEMVKSIAEDRKKYVDDFNDKADKLLAIGVANAQSLKTDALLVSNGTMERQMKEVCDDLAAKAPWYAGIRYGPGWYDRLKREILGK